MSTPTPIHVMLDLETLAKGADAAIVQVSAVAFYPYTGEVLAVEPFDAFVCDNQPGRTVDPTTVAWWLTQSRAKHLGEVMLARGQHLGPVLCALREWFAQLVANTEAHPYTLAGVWSHGLTFDVPILEHAYRTLGFGDPPWGYRTPRDTRTVYALACGGEPPRRRQKGDPGNHDALSDCRAQIVSLVDALRRLRAAGVELGVPLPEPPAPANPWGEGGVPAGSLA